MNTETWIRVWARGTPVVCPGVCPENIGIECRRKGTVLINLPPDGDAVCAFHADGSITDTHPGHALAAGIGAARAEAHAHTHACTRVRRVRPSDAKAARDRGNDRDAHDRDCGHGRVGAHHDARGGGLARVVRGNTQRNTVRCVVFLRYIGCHTARGHDE